MNSIYNITFSELKDWLANKGYKPYHAKQVYEWLYQKFVADFDTMSNLSKPLRSELCQAFSTELPHIITEQHDTGDATYKLLLELDDQERVEAVLMPRISDKGKTDPKTGKIEGLKSDDIANFTTCLSTQAGCLYACKFCASGQGGLDRNLNAGEIVSQFMHFLRQGKPVNRIVFMGMGEPLHNYDQVKRAVDIFTAKEGLGMSSRRITLSTVGLVPEVYRLAMEDWKCKLAVSLHATTDEKRSELIPISKAYALDQLMDALRFYQRRQGRRISFEYLMIHNFNDTKKDAERLIKMCKDMVSHVNLIPYNTVPRMPFQPSSTERIRNFRKMLVQDGIDATVRYSRGRNIDAACGQLRLRHES